MSKLVILAAGGTGSHLFPAEALARELISRGYRVALVTDPRGQAFGDKLGVELHRIRAGRIGGGIASKVVAAAEVALGTFEAQRLLKKLAPAATITCTGKPLAFPMHLPDEPLRGYLGDYGKMPLAEGIRETYESFRDLLERGALSAAETA